MLKVNDWGGDEFEPVLVLCTRPETAVCMYIFEQRHYPPQTTLFATPAYNSQPFKAQQPESQPQPQRQRWTQIESNSKEMVHATYQAWPFN